jgi:hypothetical protein
LESRWIRSSRLAAGESLIADRQAHYLDALVRDAGWAIPSS